MQIRQQFSQSKDINVIKYFIYWSRRIFGLALHFSYKEDASKSSIRRLFKNKSWSNLFSSTLFAAHIRSHYILTQACCSQLRGADKPLYQTSNTWTWHRTSLTFAKHNQQDVWWSQKCKVKVFLWLYNVQRMQFVDWWNAETVTGTQFCDWGSIK